MPDETNRIDAHDYPKPGRALVAITSVRRRGSDDRPLTDFLAQLIACNRRLPAYRIARKADPESGASAYAGIHATTAASRLDRSV